jgi:cytochrome c-type biogenesis protein CcmH/NrfG
MQIEERSDMAVTKMEERVIALHTGMKIIYAILVLLIPSLLGWGWYITTNVVAMKQALASQNTKLITELKNPSSPEQLRASLRETLHKSAIQMIIG